MQATLHFPERRRRNLRGRLARATYPVRSAVGEFIDGMPCNVIGHKWVEASGRARRKQGDKKMHFKCSRCATIASFTN
jgi:hypothetical protein